MIIAINTRLLLKDKLEGIGFFLYETLRRMTAAHPEDTFLFLFDRPYDPSFILAKRCAYRVITARSPPDFIYPLV
ncbi:MAG: hypothetical protein HC817_06685 [Saprospiraceae bacterium]|nr:hypothetical protein [Saprospiraceae bacterium]